MAVRGSSALQAALARALRPGSLVLHALQDLALAYLRRDGDAIPVWRMATLTIDDLRSRAATIAPDLVVDTMAVPGGGTLLLQDLNRKTTYGGVNISPVEVENILFSHPDVENVAVVGEPDQRLGERVCAFVIVKQGKTLCIGDLQEWLTAAGLAKPKWPERLESVSALPMTASGKVQKYRLREMLVGSLK